MNKSYLKSVEQGYMSIEQARQMVLGNSGSNVIDTSWAAITNNSTMGSFGGISDYIFPGHKSKIRCPYCGRKNDSDKEVCGGCGGNL